MTSPEECKYYYKCSCNKCPLDSDKNNKEISRWDKQKWCTVERKEIREANKLIEGILV